MLYPTIEKILDEKNDLHTNIENLLGEANQLLKTLLVRRTAGSNQLLRIYLVRGTNVLPTTIKNLLGEKNRL
jgi:hypothetical protein